MQTIHTVTIWWSILSALGLLLNFQKVLASVTLTPEVVQACPEETVTFTCTVTGGNKLYWDVDYADPSFSDIIGKVFRTTDSPGRQISSVNNAGQSFQFTLISTSPLTSNASTVNSRQLSGTQVRCENTLSHSSTSEIQVVAGPDSINSVVVVNTVHNYTVNVATAHITVSLQNTVIGDHKYFVTVTPPVETGPSNFETRDETFQVTVLYNQEYNVSVVANNCAGNSSSVSTSFNINTDANMDNVVTAVDCGFPNMTKGAEVLMNHFASTTENSVVVLKCAEGLFPNHSVTTVCTSKGKWNPDPATHTCRPLEMNGTTGSYPNLCLHSAVNGLPIFGHVAIAGGLSVIFYILGMVTTLVIQSVWSCCNDKTRCQQEDLDGRQIQDVTSEPVYSECILPATADYHCNSTNHQLHLSRLNMDKNVAYGRGHHIYI